nr:FGFR1 oncogene partner [Loxodonta africana]
MAATATAVVAEEDTELRDLLVQTLENSGVLNRIKAELRAAVFLALEEQEKVENKTPLVNESLKKFLNTKDGRLVASLVAEFLQFFNLDFTLAVFQPETSTLQGLEGRENLARDLGIIEAEGTVGGPLLLEVIRRCQQKEKGPTSGEGALDLSDVHSPPKSPEGKTSSHTIPSKKSSETSQSDTSTSSSEQKSKNSLHLLAHETKAGSFLSNKSLDGKDKAGLRPDEDDVEGDSFFDDPIPKPEKTYGWRSEPSKQRGGLASLSDAPPLKSGLSSLAGAPSLKDSESKCPGSLMRFIRHLQKKRCSTELQDPSRCGAVPQAGDCLCSWRTLLAAWGKGLPSLLLRLLLPGGDVMAAGSGESGEVLYCVTPLLLAARVPVCNGSYTGPDGGPRAPIGIGSHTGPVVGPVHLSALGLARGPKGTAEEDDYVDDFNSASHRSEKSEMSIGEEMEEDLSVEVDDINTSDKLDDLTQDLTVSQLSDVADYLEDVA